MWGLQHRADCGKVTEWLADRNSSLLSCGSQWSNRGCWVGRQVSTPPEPSPLSQTWSSLQQSIVAQDVLESMAACLLQPLDCWDYRQEPLSAGSYWDFFDYQWSLILVKLKQIVSVFVIFVLLSWSQNPCFLHQECKKHSALCFISDTLFLFHHVIYDQLCANILCMEWNEFQVLALIWISVVQQYCYEYFLSIWLTGALVRSGLTEMEASLAPVLCSQWGPPIELQQGRNPHRWGKLPLCWLAGLLCATTPYYSYGHCIFSPLRCRY